MIGRRFYLFLFLQIAIVCAYAQTNRALVIAISKYPEYSGWEDINAHNDIGIVCKLLADQGYKESNIRILAAAGAKKKDIVNALQNLCQTIRTGDYVYLHFSCHGQQMMDDNGDEEDGLDEAIVPYDASYWYAKGKYEGENHLRDDELGVWIDKMRGRAGSSGNIVVVMDACHSGTGNRIEQDEYIRGTGAIFGPEDYVPKPGKNQALSLRLKPKPNYAPTVVFSACQSDENNIEHLYKGKYYGALTYAFDSLVRNISSGMTLKTFMEKLMATMKDMKKKKNAQTPYMECVNANNYFKLGR